MTKKIELPEQMSALLELALDDLAKIEKNRRYTVSMGSWHVYSPNTDTCFVCLAGAVMACSLKMPIEKNVKPEDFDDETGYCLTALDYLRVGDIDAAYAARYGEGGEVSDKLPLRVEVPAYGADKAGWWVSMWDLVKTLKAAGD
jgi:hypothetical protein